MANENAGMTGDRAVLESLEPRLLLSGSVVITEFMADNISAHADGDGQFSDWIELHNPGGESVDLDGWFLSDDEAVKIKWRFPAVTLDPGEYLVVFASSQAAPDYVDAGGHLHTNFALDSDGESVVLTRSDGVTVANSFIDYPEQLPNVSYGLTGVTTALETLVSDDQAVSFRVPTPGDAGDLPDPGASEGWTAAAFDDSSWNSEIRLDAAGMIITEINSGDTDFVEIQNASDSAISTTGWSVLVNDPTGGINGVNAIEWSLPASIGPGELLFRSDDPVDGADYWGGDIDWTAGQDGWAMIVGDSGEVIDFVVWGYDASEIASMSFTHGVHTIDADGQWTGDGAIVGDGTGSGVPEPEEDKLVFSSQWAWLHPTDGVDPATGDADFHTTWTQPTGYDGPAFAPPGAGVLGYDNISYSPVVTDIGKPNSGLRYSAYFRRELVLDKNLVNAGIEMLCDDGAIVYIDGVEVARANITGPDGYMAMADDASGTEDNTITLSIPDMTVGSHWIAVSLHQASTGSSDLGFAMRLFGQPSLPPGSALQRSGDSDNDAAGDFQATDAPDKDVQNAGLTLPFGYLTDTLLGIGFSDDQQSFDDIIVTDIESQAKGVNASVWTRIEFDAGDVSHLGNLTLNVKYDDGFIAYLNGVEVARRNADNPLTYDVSASAARDNAQAVAFEPINISAHLGELVAGSNVLAIHALNETAADADMLLSVELAASNTVYDAEASWFTTPSPGALNLSGGGFPGIVINEIHYDPDVRTELVEFIELHNGSDSPVDLSGWFFSDGVDYTFAPGASIAAGGYLVIGQNVAQIQSKFGISGVLGPYAGSLDGDGEQLVLRNADGARIDQVEYRRGFPWPIVGDSPGRSIELVNPSLDNDLGGSWRPSASGPTPGAENSVFVADRNTAPHMRQVSHGPDQPVSGQDVTVTAKVTDVHGVADVTLHYQLVDPGAYIAHEDAAYQTGWADLAMVDDGTGGDAAAGDDIYTVVIPGAIQTNRRLVRYRITATDASPAALSRTAPYAEDEAGNFAYYVYDGVPDWTGSAQPGTKPDVTYSSDVLTTVPVYTLITNRQDRLNAQHVPYRDGQGDQELPTSGSYGGSDYLWTGTLIYDGVVYDNIHYRARGGVWRYAMGKNMWKFDFNRGHSFQARDDYGNLYDTKWDKLNFSALIQQGNFLHRGEQGMFEAAGFKMFNLTGVEAPKTNWVHFRVVEGADENGPDQYSGDFQGLYMAIEQMDGRFLDEHNLPDGNLYKIEGHNAQLPKNNQGHTAVADTSDHAAFRNILYGDPNPGEQWWRDNVELEKYYSYRAVVEGIHHGDIAYGKNYFYYLNPETDLWSMLPWDLDLTWANNMYGNGEDPFRAQGAILGVPALEIEFENRLREIEDLLYNDDQMFALLDELARVPDDPTGGLSIIDADRAMWDYNPIMISTYVNSGKSGHGRFYERSATGDFEGMVQLMKDYVTENNRSFATDLSDPDLPQTPTITYLGTPGFPINRLEFQSSAFSSPSGAAFEAMEWRIGRVTDPTAPNYDPDAPVHYEITDVWNSGELAVFDDQITAPPAGLEVGAAYRARVRIKDDTGRWSRWSDPVQFHCGQSDETPLTQSLRVTEIMYNPAAAPPGGDYAPDEFEFVELRNVGDQTIDISGVSFTDGITFSFAASGVESLDPGQFVIVAKNPTALASRYDTSVLSVVGGYPDQLSNGGEKLRISDTADGIIQSFDYKDGWYDTTDGGGFSLTIVDELADRDQWDNKSNWTASGPVGGSPGTENGGVAPGSIVINEVLAHSDGYPNDIVELYNSAATDIDVGGWFLSDSNDSNDDLMKYRIAAGVIIPAGGHLLLTEDDNFGAAASDPGSNAAFALSEFGDDLWLSSYAEVEIEGVPTIIPGGYRQHVDFGASPNGVTFGVHVKTTGGTDFALLEAPTFGPLAAGHVNAAPLMDDIVINEVMYNPPAPTPGEIFAGFTDADDFEFVELYNRGSTTVDLTQYYLGEGVGFSFGWYGADADGDEIRTLQARATAQWTATLVPGQYQVYARWSVLDGEGGARSLDSAAGYEIAYDGGTDTVTLDQNVNPDPDGWVLLNTYDFNGAATVDLTRGTDSPDEWTIADQIKFVSTSGGPTVIVDNDSGDFTASECDITSLAPGEYLLLVGNAAAFAERYGALSPAGEYSGQLANDGEKLKLLRAGTPEVISRFIPYYRADYVNYGDELPWPVEADGQGASLSRISTEAYGNDAGSWATGSALGTPGVENVYLDTTPPTIPANLTSANVDGVLINLDWDDSGDLQSHVDHYAIYRNSIQIGTSATSDYSDSSVEATEPYIYRVTAINRDGYESEMSDQELVVIPGVVLVETVSAFEIRVTFSEPVEAASAENLANYVLDAATILDASLEPNGVTVALATSELQTAQSYLLTINNIETVFGGVMPANLQESFVFHLEGSGTILREWWTGIGGNEIPLLTSSPNYPDNPTGTQEMTSFEGPSGFNDSYGTRMRGYVHPPETGNYVFWIATDDNGQLWLSTDDDPANKQLIASVTGWAGSREWYKFSSQESTDIRLVAGQRYYIEALHKEGGGGDNIAVAWRLPDSTFEGPIPGNRLSPWIDNTAPYVLGGIDDVSVDQNDPDSVVNLSGAFADNDPGDTLTFSVSGNTNVSLVGASVVGSQLTLSYASGEYGTANITIRAADRDMAWIEDTFTVTVDPIGDAPTVENPISDVTVNEDASDTLIDLSSVFADPDIGDVLTLSIVDNTNTALVSGSLDGTDLTLEYSADQNGSADITIRATDPVGLWIEDTFTVTVDPVNDAPTVANPIVDFNVDEDAGDTIIDLSTVFDDPDLPGDTLAFTLESNSNPPLVDVDLTGGTLTLSYAADSFGSADIVIRATDQNGAGAWVEDSFTVTVDPVNDAPTVVVPIADVTVDEDADDTAIDLSGVFDDVDLPGDALTFTVWSNTNASLVSANIVDSELTLSYGADRNGSAGVTIRATDSSGLYAAETFGVTVDPIEDDPVIVSPIEDFVVVENAADTDIDLRDVFHDAEDGVSMTYTVESNSNPSLVSANIAGSDLTLSYAAQQVGSADMTIRATDSAGGWIEDVFAVTVEHIAGRMEVRINLATGGVAIANIDPPGGKAINYNGLEIISTPGLPSDPGVLDETDWMPIGHWNIGTPHQRLVLDNILRDPDWSGRGNNYGSFGVLSPTPSSPSTRLFTEASLTGYALLQPGAMWGIGNPIVPGSTITPIVDDVAPGDFEITYTLSGQPILLRATDYVFVDNFTPLAHGSLEDVSVLRGDPDTVVDLSEVFADFDTLDTLTYTISGDTSASTSAEDIVGDQLTLSYGPGTGGVSDITVRATDPSGAWVEDAFTVTVTAAAEVAARHVFYDNSAWDGVSDDDAIDASKAALLPGQTASAANWTSCSRGINGIMVDVTGLAGAPDETDFLIEVNQHDDPDTWTGGPSPTVSVRSGEGVDSSDRVVLTWSDGEIVNQWVRVTVLATPQTGLSDPDVFGFGSAVGDVDGDGAVDDNDLGSFQSEFGLRGGFGALANDLDADGRVGLKDFAIMRSRFGETVLAPTLPVSAPLAAPAPGPGLVTSVNQSPLSNPATNPEGEFAAVSVSELSLPQEADQPASAPAFERELTGVLSSEDSSTDLQDDLLVDVLAEAPQLTVL